MVTGALVTFHYYALVAIDIQIDEPVLDSRSYMCNHPPNPKRELEYRILGVVGWVLCQYFGSDNGLAPAMRQAIIWTNELTIGTCWLLRAMCHTPFHIL